MGISLHQFHSATVIVNSLQESLIPSAITVLQTHFVFTRQPEIKIFIEKFVWICISSIKETSTVYLLPELNVYRWECCNIEKCQLGIVFNHLASFYQITAQHRWYTGNSRIFLHEKLYRHTLIIIVKFLLFLPINLEFLWTNFNNWLVFRKVSVNCKLYSNHQSNRTETESAVCFFDQLSKL